MRVRRGNLLLWLMITFAVIGASLFSREAFKPPHDDSDRMERAAAVLFLLGTTAGVMGMLKARRDRRAIVAQLNQVVRSGLRQLEAPSADETTVAAAMNDLVAVAERAMSD